MSESNTSAKDTKERSGKTVKVVLALVIAVALVAGSSAATVAVTLTTVTPMTPASATVPVRGGDLIPDDLREDLLAAWEAPEANRPELIADIREAATAGDYGPAVQRLIERIDDTIAEQSPELQTAIDQLRAETNPDERRELIQQLREDIDAGVYGDEAQDRVDDLRTAFREHGARGLLRDLLLRDLRASR